jgi:hypothetical protein
MTPKTKVQRDKPKLFIKAQLFPRKPSLPARMPVLSVHTFAHRSPVILETRIAKTRRDRS